MPKSNRKKAYLALLINAFIWGSALPIIKKGFSQIDPFLFLFYRYFFATTSSIPIFFILGKKLKIKLKQIPQLLLLGFFSSLIAHSMLYKGLSETSALESGLIMSLIPIFITIAAAIFLHEKITKTEKIGTLFAFIASTIIIIEPFIYASENIDNPHPFGNLLILGHNIIWTFSILWMKKLAKKVHPFLISFSISFCGFIGFLFLNLFTQPDFLQYNLSTNPKALSAVLYMGILGSTLAFFLYQFGQSRIEASEATLFTYLQTLFTITLSIFWLKEFPRHTVILSSFIILIGVVIAETRWKKSKKKAKK